MKGHGSICVPFSYIQYGRNMNSVDFYPDIHLAIFGQLSICVQIYHVVDKRIHEISVKLMRRNGQIRKYLV